MPSASTLSAYLAKNYLTADRPSTTEKKSKKRKRHADQQQNGLSIADDNEDAWGKAATNTNAEDEDSPSTILNSASADFRRKKTSQWQTLSGTPATLASENDSTAAAEAEAIIRSAEAEHEARAAAERDAAEDAPAVVEEAMVMSNGAHAGLQSAADMAEQMAAHRRREAGATGDTAGNAKGETIYRDASGRVVNIAMKRAEARAAAEAAETKKRQQEEAARGDVQRVQREERRQELENAKLMPFARNAEDEQMNAELKARDVWGDPMAGQLESVSLGTKGDRKKSIKVVKTSTTGRPLYAGSAPPNRYGIRPGHKWDGVDRGTGFESEWFKARNSRKDRAALEWNWQMDE